MIPEVLASWQRARAKASRLRASRSAARRAGGSTTSRTASRPPRASRNAPARPPSRNWSASGRVAPGKGRTRADLVRTAPDASGERALHGGEPSHGLGEEGHRLTGGRRGAGRVAGGQADPGEALELPGLQVPRPEVAGEGEGALVKRPGALPVPPRELRAGPGSRGPGRA